MISTKYSTEKTIQKAEKYLKSEKENKSASACSPAPLILTKKISA